MKRDMDLVRLILLKIEEEYVSTAIFNLKIEGYDMATVAYHCKIMHDAGLLSEYKGKCGNDTIYAFAVASLTWEGSDYLDKVRDNTVWKKTKDVIKEKGLPLIFDTIKTISTAFITATAEGVATAVIKTGTQGGQV